jgi:hypothetical protein
MADSWRIHGGFMADSWRIHGGFMADSWRIHGGFMADSYYIKIPRIKDILILGLKVIYS